MPKVQKSPNLVTLLVREKEIIYYVCVCDWTDVKIEIERGRGRHFLLVGLA